MLFLICYFALSAVCAIIIDGEAIWYKGNKIHSENFNIITALPYTVSQFQWCVDDLMSVRMKGSVIQFGGADPTQVVHTSRLDCYGFSQGWKDVVVIDLMSFKSFVVNYAVVGGTNICSTSLLGCSCDYNYPVDTSPAICGKCTFSCNGAQQPIVSIAVQSIICATGYYNFASIKF